VSRPNLARLGRFAAVIVGVLYAAVSAFRLVLTSMAGSSSSALIALAALTLVVFPLVDNFVTLCFAVGLTGLHAFLGRRSVLGISRACSWPTCQSSPPSLP